MHQRHVAHSSAVTQIFNLPPLGFPRNTDSAPNPFILILILISPLLCALCVNPFLPFRPGRSGTGATNKTNGQNKNNK